MPANENDPPNPALAPAVPAKAGGRPAKTPGLGTLSPEGEDRFTLLPTTRYVAWVAIGVGAGLAALSPLAWARLAGAGAALLILGAQFILRARRPTLVIDAGGYRVEVGGRARFSVRWEEVQRVLRDAAEEAMYIDCGDPRRNLLLPPRAGFAFTFTQRERLYALLNSLVGGRAQDVPRFDRELPAPARHGPEEPLL